MPIIRLAAHQNGAAYVEVDASVNADGSLVVSSVSWQNLTAKPFTFRVRRATGVTVMTRSIPADTAPTSTTVSGSATNRTIIDWSSAWGS